MSADLPAAAGTVWFRRSPGVSRRWLEREARTSRTPTVGDLPSAEAVWGLLEEPRTFRELVSILEEAWGAGGRIPREVEAVLADFIERGLVEAVGSTD